MNKVCVITGGSSGIGKACAEEMRDAGYTVYELSRREIANEGINHLFCDVTSEDAVHSAVQEIMSKEDHIDVLINNAGYGIAGAVEFTSMDDAKKQLDVNFFGMVRMNKEVIPIMRRQGYGKILNTSSVAGCCPLPFQTFYSASKAAINSYTMATANEIRPFGVQMCAIQPGDIATGFTAARNKIFEGDDIYAGRIGRNFAGIEKDETTGQKPEMAGKMIAKTAQKKKLKPIYTISFVYKLLCFLERLLPKSVVNYFLYRLYAK